MTGSYEDYIQYRIDRSAEIFQDAELLAENKRWRSCVNRLYYSCFHLVNALLFQDDIMTKTHEGLKTKFLQHFVKTGKIGIEYGKLYARLIDWRQESDYAAYVSFSDRDVLPLLGKVEEFNTLLIKMITSRK